MKCHPFALGVGTVFFEHPELEWIVECQGIPEHLLIRAETGLRPRLFHHTLKVIGLFTNHVFDIIG